MFRTKGLNKKYHKRVIYDKRSRDPGGGVCIIKSVRHLVHYLFRHAARSMGGGGHFFGSLLKIEVLKWETGNYICSNI